MNNKCSCNCICCICIVFVCVVCPIVCVVCVVFRLSVGLFCVMCVTCVLCLILAPLPPGKNPFAVKIIIIIIIKWDPVDTIMAIISAVDKYHYKDSGRTSHGSITAYCEPWLFVEEFKPYPSALDGCDWSYSLVASPSGIQPFGTHWIGDRVGPTAGLEFVAMRKFSASRQRIESLFFGCNHGDTNAIDLSGLYKMSLSQLV
jgi:hypothetical protein